MMRHEESAAAPLHVILRQKEARTMMMGTIQGVVPVAHMISAVPTAIKCLSSQPGKVIWLA